MCSKARCALLRISRFGYWMLLVKSKCSNNSIETLLISNFLHQSDSDSKRLHYYILYLGSHHQISGDGDCSIASTSRISDACNADAILSTLWFFERIKALKVFPTHLYHLSVYCWLLLRKQMHFSLITSHCKYYEYRD